MTSATVAVHSTNLHHGYPQPPLQQTTLRDQVSSPQPPWGTKQGDGENKGRRATSSRSAPPRRVAVYAGLADEADSVVSDHAPPPGSPRR